MSPLGTLSFDGDGMNMAPGDCGLYVHIPYCTSKCGYCDFYSVELAGLEFDGFMGALQAELRHRVASRREMIRTIFVGGGTPTVLPIEYLAKLMEWLGEVARSQHCDEFTVEANPGTVDREKLKLLTAAGVNRISMGAQSFFDEELKWLQRDHPASEIGPSVRLVREFGIRRLNIDLIFGIGNQTMRSWEASIDRALELETDHLSCYGLTYEPGTLMTAMKHRGELVPCDEDLEAAMYLRLIDRLEEAGFEQYEISNFAKPGQACRHNLIYWNNLPYIGVGPSASGYLDGTRYKNVSNIRYYIERIQAEGTAVEQSEQIEGRRLAAETIMLQLRLRNGIDVPVFCRRFDIDLERELSEPLQRFESLGWLERLDNRIRLTRNGLLMADGVITDFMYELDEAEVRRAAQPPTSRSLRVVAS